MKIIKRIKRKLAYEIYKRDKIRNIKTLGGYVGKSTDFVLLGNFTYGKNLGINDRGSENYTKAQIVVLPGANLIIGDNVGMTQVSILCKKSITIGSNVKIGAGTKIIDSNFHSTDYLVRRDLEKDLVSAVCSDVKIGDDCFIGTRTLICKGVSIGARTIIAAGSVVVKDIPSDCIAGGNPCKVIKSLIE